MTPIFRDLPQEFLDAIESAIAIKNTQGVILSCNKAFQNLNRSTTRNLVGLSAHDYLPAKEANFFTKADRELLSNPTVYLRYQFERQNQDSSRAIYHTHKSIAHIQSGSSEILIVINTTIQNTTGGTHFGLTPRELITLELLVLGNTQKQIAIALGISHHTAADHMKAIYSKLGVNTRTSAQLKAITQLGIGSQQKAR